MAVGGVGIVSGMAPKGGFDIAMVEDLIARASAFTARPPGDVATHHEATGFFTRVYEQETGVLDGLKEYMRAILAYGPEFFQAAAPKAPAFPLEDLYHLLPANQKEVYDFDEVLARLVDGSERLEFRPGYGPEVFIGVCKIDGRLVGCIGNRQGYLGKGYPEYADYPGMGGKLYRQGLIKMNEFVTLCGRDRLPIIWFQDTSGIDVGELAEKAEVLGLGQGLIYSIQQTGVPMMLVVLRKGTAAAHYVMGGPTANRHNAFTLGTPATEIEVMHGETAAVATYARRAAKEHAAGRGGARVGRLPASPVTPASGTPGSHRRSATARGPCGGLRPGTVSGPGQCEWPPAGVAPTARASARGAEGQCPALGARNAPDARRAPSATAPTCDTPA